MVLTKQLQVHTKYMFIITPQYLLMDTQYLLDGWMNGWFDTVNTRIDSSIDR